MGASGRVGATGRVGAWGGGKVGAAQDGRFELVSRMAKESLTEVTPEYSHVGSRGLGT